MDDEERERWRDNYAERMDGLAHDPRDDCKACPPGALASHKTVLRLYGPEARA